MSKKTLTFIVVIVLVAIGGFYYWFFVRNSSPSLNTTTAENGGGSPIFGNSGGATNGNGATNTTGSNTSTGGQTGSVPAVPMLRELSTTPVGGMEASTTASSTIIRWIDRGAGRVYQAYSNNLAVDELSNTTVPQVYSTYWNNTATSFILQSLTDDSDAINTFYTTLYPVAETSSSSSTISTTPTASSTPFELRGSPLPATTLTVAISPKGDQVFTLENAVAGSNSGSSLIGASSIGYISQFNGSKKTQIFTTPLSAINVEWPEQNTIAVTTKGASNATGFLYFINPKTGIFNKILGDVAGLSTLTSKDAANVLYTASINNGIRTGLFNVKSGTSQDMLFNTMPEKCVWSNLQKNIVYCAVPSTIPSASYPEDWYKGKVSFSDSIWEVDITTGDAHEIADLLKVSSTVIDATNLVLDPQENYLYFINKNNLTLWSLELNG